MSLVKELKPVCNFVLRAGFPDQNPSCSGRFRQPLQLVPIGMGMGVLEASNFLTGAALNVNGQALPAMHAAKNRSRKPRGAMRAMCKAKIRRATHNLYRQDGRIADQPTRPAH
jgi:hypothetical protein